MDHTHPLGEDPLWGHFKCIKGGQWDQPMGHVLGHLKYLSPIPSEDLQA